MKKLTIALSLILCVVICVFAFSSCGKKKKPAVTNDPGTAATTDRWEILGPEIAAKFSEDQRTFRFEMSGYSDAEKTSKNDKYLAGPDAAGSQETIGQLVYERNTNANRLLGTKVEYVYWDGEKSQYGWGNQAARINEVVQGNDPEAPDLFVNMLYDLNKALLTVSAFKDLWSIPGSYFDFSAKGWMEDWMKSLSFSGDRAYILGSDYFVDIFRNMGVLPFNMTLMDENGAKLATALFGEGNGLSGGETMSARFFDHVENELWTWDSLKKLCEAIYVDTDGDNQTSFGDTLGIITERYSGMSAAIILYASGETLTVSEYEKDENGVEKKVTKISYLPDSTVLGEIFDAVKGVYEADGALTTNSDSGDPGIAEHYNKFARNEVLFADPSLLGTLEDDVFQQMKPYKYSVVPIPKVSVDKKYNTVIHNTADVGAINVRTEKAAMISAYLQYVTEHSQDVKTEFLQTVVKFKTTDYDQGTDRMLELIYDHFVDGRDKAIEDAVDCKGGRSYRFHGMLKDGGFVRGSDYIATAYQASVDAKQSIVDEILTRWNALPTAETEAASE